MELLSRRGRESWYGVLILVLVCGCTGETPSTPSTLIDGSPARPLTVALEGVDIPTVATVVRVTPADSAAAESAAASCIASIGTPAKGAIVERVGVSGRSVTFLGGGRRSAHACDARTRGDNVETWCGHAFGRVESGRLRDPRLSLSCRSAADDPIGFAWIQPNTATTFVVVRQSGYAEVYVVAANAPMRVTTTDTDPASSHATFAISEHTRAGRQVRQYELEAHVSG